MSISRRQQELLDESIASFIKNNDRTSQQYLKVRQEIYRVSSNVAKARSAGEEPLKMDLFELEKLQYDFDKASSLYLEHLRHISTNIDISEKIKSPYLSELDLEYDKLSARKNDLKAYILDLRDDKKPLIDDMKKLQKSFDAGVSRLAKGRRGHGSKKPDGAKDWIDLDPESALFSQEELRAMFEDVDKKLRWLKTVDEVNEDGGEKHASHVNILRYLNDHIESNRAYKRMNGKYRYDISKSTLIDAGNASSVIDDYDAAIENVTLAIKDLIEHGAEAKERWSVNAKKLETVRMALREGEEEDLMME